MLDNILVAGRLQEFLYFYSRIIASADGAVVIVKGRCSSNERKHDIRLQSPSWEGYTLRITIGIVLCSTLCSIQHFSMLHSMVLTYSSGKSSTSITIDL